MSDKQDAFDPTALDRFLELRAFARGLGCCYACSTAVAMAQVDREYDFKEPPKPVPCANGGGCFGLARSRWDERPKPEENKK